MRLSPGLLGRADGENEVRRPGIESFLAAEGIRVFFAETHSVEGGHPVGKAAGEAIGVYGAVARRYTLELTPSEQAEPGTTYEGVLGRRCGRQGGRAGAKQPHWPAGLVRRFRLSRRSLVPRVPPQGWRFGHAVLADRRSRPRSRQQAALRAGAGRRSAWASMPPLRGPGGRTCSRATRSRPASTASLPPTTIPSCSVTGGSRASTGSRRSCAGWPPLRSWT